MCDVATILSLGGTALAAQGQKEAGEFSAQVSEMNAGLARRAAIDAVQRGGVEAGKATMEGSRVVGKARAATGASGVDVQSASVLDVLGTTRMYSTLNAETIKGNAAREALGYRSQASNFEAQAQLARLEGRYGAATTLLTGISQTAGSISSKLIPILGA